MICKCGNTIPEARLKLGYKICVECSQEPKWSANPLTFHKTGNTIEVIKDPELAEEIAHKAERRNFGVMRGITGSYRKPKKPTNISTKRIDSEKEFSREKGRRKVDPTLYKFEEVGEQAMKMISEGYSVEEIGVFLSQEIQNMRISPQHKKQIIEILNEIF